MKHSGRIGGTDDDEDEDEEGANWMDSYSDLMTDLLAIFVVLFSFAMMSQAFSAAASSHRVAMFDDTGQQILAIQESAGTAQEEAVQNSQNGLINSMISYIDHAQLSEQLSVAKQGENKVLLRVSASILFNPAQSTITREARELLEGVSVTLSEYKDSIKMVWIEGHTDDRPINTRTFPSNWELSASRAINVVKYILETSELTPDQMSAIGYSEFQPIAGNDTEENRAKNRRVDFIIEMRSESDGNAAGDEPGEDGKDSDGY